MSYNIPESVRVDLEKMLAAVVAAGGIDAGSAILQAALLAVYDIPSPGGNVALVDSAGILLPSQMPVNNDGLTARRIAAQFQR